MPQYLEKELENLKRSILSLGTMAEERVRMAIRAMERRDGQLAEEIIRHDYEIDELEVEIEEECLRILALYQPVAVDLRFIGAVIKINSNLERIGDEAVNIARSVNYISSREKMDTSIDYPKMSDTVALMLKMSLDALVNLDHDAAFKVLTLDDQVDRIYHEAYDLVKVSIKEKPDRVGYLLNLFLIARHLERIADHATNIAEEVIYLIEGEIIRHGNWDKDNRTQ